MEETEKEREERLKQWENFLEDEEGGGDGGGTREGPTTAEQVYFI